MTAMLTYQESVLALSLMGILEPLIFMMQRKETNYYAT